MPGTPHNSLIARAARRALAPLGLRQRGRSRTWLDDHGWWLTVIEFQPSTFSRGTYLNVGAMWLWRRTDHLSFDYGSRVEGFAEYRTEADFGRRIAAVADRAAAEVLRYRVQFPDIAAVWRILGPDGSLGGWKQYHAAVAGALAGDRGGAEAYLDGLSSPGGEDPEWLRDLRSWAHELRLLLPHPPVLRARLDAVIRESRVALKLPEWTGSLDDVWRAPLAI